MKMKKAIGDGIARGVIYGGTITLGTIEDGPIMDDGIQIGTICDDVGPGPLAAHIKK